MGQFLNCVYGSSRIVLLTIQELSKAQCNNTDNNYTDYSDTDPFRSGRELTENDSFTAHRGRFLKYTYLV